MAPHQQRVVEEKADLDEKLSKLITFLNGEFFKTLDNNEQSRLRHQRSIMEDYSSILDQRIGAFTSN